MGVQCLNKHHPRCIMCLEVFMGRSSAPWGGVEKSLMGRDAFSRVGKYDWRFEHENVTEKM